MARAVWKGPFVEESLMKKVDKYKDDPKKTPKIIAKENPFKISPPKKKIENKASKVVTEVIIVLDNVSLIEILVSSNILISEYFLRFSLTLSNITTVSFIEYPTMVNTAATIERFISRLKSENTPKVNKTSWNKANIAPTLNCHSKRIHI